MSSTTTIAATATSPRIKNRLVSKVTADLLHSGMDVWVEETSNYYNEVPLRLVQTQAAYVSGESPTRGDPARKDRYVTQAQANRAAHVGGSVARARANCVRGRF